MDSLYESEDVFKFVIKGGQAEAANEIASIAR